MATMTRVSFRAGTLAPRRIVATRPANLVRAPVSTTSRPAQLLSAFLRPAQGLKGLCSTFAGLMLQPLRTTVSPVGSPLVVEANAKNSIGNTKRGTRRARTRTSGFRTRMQTPGGRKVLARRRARGRKVLAPASNYRK